MNYEETLEWLYAQLPMYQRQGAVAYKKDLSNTHLLAKHLNNPEKKFKSIHIAGTNGKGSVSHMLASILHEAGYKVGLYTSPHLKDFRERIRINGQKIESEYITKFIAQHQSFFEENLFSFFEMTVGLAFQYFTDLAVDIAVIETGLGGRLDSTNIILPEISVITNIGLDHTSILGNTLEEIAVEKAGIIKPKVPVIIGRSLPETKPIFKKTARLNRSPIYWAEEHKEILFDSDLQGDYQEENIRTAMKACSVLQKQEWSLTDEHLKNGFRNVVKNTSLLGRWQVLQHKPKVICDTAHNADGLRIVIKQIMAEPYASLHIVLGMVRDKDLIEILRLFPTDAHYYFTKPNMSRGLDEKVLQQKAKLFQLRGETYRTVKEAYKTAVKNADPSDFIYIGGSTFVVAEVI